jgi:hypothetical protein
MGIMRLREGEWHKAGWQVVGGVSPHVWGPGLLVEIGHIEQKLEVAVGPFYLLLEHSP